MTIGTVCSGIGAPEIALDATPLWFSEIEKFPSAVLAHHYPDVPNLGDFTTDEAIEYMVANPPDVFVGGTPCQSFSVAGKRGSLDDDRGNLTLVFTEVWHRLRAVGTRYAVWENVPGALNTKDNAFGCFVSAMVGADTVIQPTGGKWQSAGMADGPRGTIAWRVLDAQFWGVPQRRRRIFAVIGHPRDFSVAKILFEREGVFGDSEASSQTGEEVARSVGTGTYEASTGESIGISPCLDARAADGPRRNQGGVLVGEAQVYENHPNDSRVKGPLNVCEQLTARNGTGGGNLPLVQEVAPTKASFTLGGDDQPHAVSTGMAVRRLTPVECERLQGFPDGWTKIPWRGKATEQCPDGPQYKAIGNSMAIPCVKFIADRIKEGDDG